MNVKVRRPYDRWIEQARSEGMVRGVPVGDALYLLRVRELRKIVNVRASGHDVFSVSLGQVAFKQSGLTNRYRIYNVLPKRWVDLLK